MQIATSRFGDITVTDDEVITFPDGLPGFAGRRQMVLIGGGQLEGDEDSTDADHHLLFWIQDTVDPDLAFLTIVPWQAYPDYDIDIDPNEVGVDDPDAVCVLSIVTVRREDGGVQMTTNLRAPVVINTTTSEGRQVILDDITWPVNAPLAASAPPAHPVS